MNRAAIYRLLICALALSGLLTGCFLFPAAVKHETLLAPFVGQRTTTAEADGTGPYKTMAHGDLSLIHIRRCRRAI